MFDLKGSILIQVKDADTLEIKEEIECDNLILNNTHSRLTQSEDQLNLRVFISTETATPSRTATSINGTLAVSYVPSGVVSPRWFHNANPSYGQIQQRIDPIGVNRTFSSLGLTDANENNNLANTTVNAYTWLKLPTPCTQGANDILDLFYRISFVNTSSNFKNDKAIKDFAGNAFARYGAIRRFNLYHLAFSLLGMPPSSYTDPVFTSGTAYANGSSSSFYPTDVDVVSHFKRKIGFNLGTANEVGTVFNTMFHGQMDSKLTASANHVGADPYDWSSAYTWEKFSAQSDKASVQTIFGHSALATVPFFDSLALPSGGGKVYFDLTTSGWVGKWPEMYKVWITQAGGVGTSTYRFAVRKHLGFSGNTWTDKFVPNTYMNTKAPAFPGAHGWTEADSDVSLWSESQVVEYDLNGVTLLDLFNGNYTNWDSTTTPALNAVNIGQVAADPANNRIYVGCRTTGLYLIDVSANTVTRLSTDPCYGVDVGRNGNVFAVLGNRLVRSPNWTTALTFVNSTVTSDWARVRYIKVDPEHADDRLALIFELAGSSIKSANIYWWNAANSTVVAGPSTMGHVALSPSQLDVSDTGGHWAALGARLTFNSAATSSVSLASRTEGSLSRTKVTFRGADLIATGSGQLVSPSGTVLKSLNANLEGTSGATWLYLGSNLILTPGGVRTLVSDNSDGYVWVVYGWNGSQWVKDHSGSKTTHTAVETLINGVRVRFENGTGASHFVTNEWYNTSVNYGVLKDNVSTVSYAFSFYTKPCIFNHPLPSGATALRVPTTAPYQVTLPIAPTGNSPDPDFIRIETDATHLTQITLNGTAVTSTYFNGQTPGVNEVTVNGVTGVLTFNAADAGKAVGGFYSYLKH